MVTALHHFQLVSDGEITHGKAVLMEGQFIIAIVNEADVPQHAERVDLKGAYLSPGLIDLQIYGSGSPLFFGENPSVEALAQMEQSLLNQGCTGFLSTIATNTPQVVEQGIHAALSYLNANAINFMGLHMEGPYLNAKRKGAHPESLIKKATLAEVKRWIELADGAIKMITLAPELQDSEVLEYIDAQGIIISSGHSDATYEQAKAFIHHPVTAITHLYNAMPQMHHRQPGIIPAVFEEKPYTSIVADGIHVNYAMIALAKRELGDKLFLITDAVTENKEGVYQHKLNNDHYIMPDGTLSGSNLSMLKAVKNCVLHAGIPLAEAVNMASLYPAKLLKSDHFMGKIDKNYLANLIVFNADFEIQSVYFKGELITKTI